CRDARHWCSCKRERTGRAPSRRTQKTPASHRVGSRKWTWAIGEAAEWPPRTPAVRLSLFFRTRIMLFKTSHASQNFSLKSEEFFNRLLARRAHWQRKGKSRQ